MVVRSVQILTTFLNGYPPIFDLYQPGTLISQDMPIGYRWHGKITQFQIFTNSRVTNAISLLLQDESGTEYPLLEAVRISRSTSPIDFIPLLGYLEGLEFSADTVLKARIVFPQNVAEGDYITLIGFAEETGLGTDDITEPIT